MSFVMNGDRPTVEEEKNVSILFFWLEVSLCGYPLRFAVGRCFEKFIVDPVVLDEDDVVLADGFHGCSLLVDQKIPFEAAAAFRLFLTSRGIPK